jgi:Tfp pilus assembly protein PilV
LTDLRGHAAHAGALRRWQVFTSDSAYARMNGAVIVTCARSARQKSLLTRNFLMHEKM